MDKKLSAYLILVILISFPGCGKSPSPEARAKENNSLTTLSGKIAFGTSRGNDAYSIAVYENADIKIVNQDGGNRPKWSPSGREVLWIGAAGVVRMDVYTEDKRIITEPAGIEIDAAEVRWLPDESGIIVLGRDKKKEYTEGIPTPYNLYLYKFEEQSWKQFTHYSGTSGIYGFDIFQNGERILCSYSSNWSGLERGTYIMDLATGEMQKIKDWAGSYKIMPNQKSFLATRGITKGEQVASMSEIAFVNLETGEEKILTNDGFSKSSPTVSPDGRYALYSAHVPVGYDETAERIFMIDLETSEKREVFDRKPGYAGKIPHDRSPDWHV